MPFATPSVTRRGFVAGAAVLAASAAASASAARASEPSGAEAGEAGPAGAPEASEERAFDVVVVGAGAAGLAAAASAAEEGARVACLEKLGASMGAGTYYGFVNTELLRANGVEDVDLPAYEKSLREASLGMASPRLVHAFASRSAEVGDWLAGVAEQTGNQALFSQAMGSLDTMYMDDAASGSSAYGALTAYGASLGAEHVYGCEAVALERGEDGRVAAVIGRDAQTGACTRFLAAKGVVLAAGGFSGDRALMAELIGWVDMDAVAQYSPIALSDDASSNGNMGDGIRLARQVGALVPAGPACPMIHYIQGAMPMAGSLFVNGAGERFIDEGTSMEVMAQTVMRQPGHALYQIADAKPSGMALLMARQAEGAGAGAGGQGGGAPAQGGPASAMAGASDGPSFDTLDELAEANGLDPQALAATVARWNELVAEGVDEDFGSDLSTAVSVDTPPYTCTRSSSCLLAAMGGPQVDERMRVLDESYRPITGLYAAGNCAGGFYGPNYPMQVQSGLARAFCTVSGYVAGKEAARRS